MKQKSHSSAKKRVKKTGTGKNMIEKSSKRHLLINKSRRQKKFGKASHGVLLDKTHEKRMQKLLPYS